jgi:transcriptional regulator with XRE-family HTH domain
MTYYKEQREKMKLSQASLAERVGISVQALQRIEMGAVLPSPQIWFRLNNVLSGRVRCDLNEYRWNGEKLYDLRVSLHITQKTLARQLSTTDAHISKWENGAQPRLTFLTRLCEQTGTRLDYFFDMPEEKAN